MMNKLRVLVVTQKVDENDDILGFFCGWLNALAKKINKTYVLALEAKNVDLAKSIELYSLDKENTSNRLNRFLKFNRASWDLCLNKKIDIIFIHMCPEYLFLIFPYAKIARIPIVMWYAHKDINYKLRLAHLLVDKVVSSSKDGFRISSNKLVITGQGINIEKFNPNAKFKVNETKRIILSVGRLSPIKNYETLIEVANILVNYMDIKDLEFRIIGDIPFESQRGYLVFLKDMVKESKLEDYLKFIGPVTYREIHNYYRNCDLFISTSNTGSLDKSTLEAMSCGKIVLTSNEAFRDCLKIYSDILMFDKNDAYDLANKIIDILKMKAEDKNILACDLREIVVRNHNLNGFVDKILTVIEDTIGSK